MAENAPKIMIPPVITVKEFSERANLPVTTVISELMKNGVLATINETIDFETASIVGEYLGLEIEKEIGSDDIPDAVRKSVGDKKDLVPRPPVVTVMGHVDHGKTSLLDFIREEHVARGESGGITQHISAYQVTLSETKNKELRNKSITFIDTPGHAAFSALREHGAIMTDIVVLIVAANDGVMPQTIEVIEQAKKHNVPVIVAINKVDLPDADVMKVKQQLTEYELLPEEWGGKTIMVEVSAKTGQGVDTLLEMILLQAELMELKANPNDQAVGIVIESNMQKGAGPAATVLIESGTLNKSDPIAIGGSYGKARILEDFAGNPILKATPGMPIRVAGLKSLPDFGDRLIALTSGKEARSTAQSFEHKKPQVAIATAKRLSSGTEDDETQKRYDLHVIIKCDVRGSLEAVSKSLTEINTSEFGIKIIASGVGPISESEVTMAQATGAIVLGFRVTLLGAAKRIAEKEGIKVKTFQVIYELIDYAKSELTDILPTITIEDELGHGTVLAIFRDDKKGFVAGGKLESGKTNSGDEIKFFQDKNEKYRTKILSLRREKSEVKEVTSGSDFGFALPAGANISVGDSFVIFTSRQQKQEV